MPTNSDISKKLAYSVPEFCAVASIGRSLVYDEIASGRLKTFKVGRRRLIPATEGQRWMESLIAAEAAEPEAA